MSQTQVEDPLDTGHPAPAAGLAPGRGTGRQRVVAVVLVVVVVIGAVSGFVLWRSSHLPGDVALRVYGNDVTRADLRKDVATLRAMYGVEPPQGKGALQRFWRDAAQASAVTRILDHAARKEDVVISGKQVEDSLAAYIAALYRGSPDPQRDFVEALSNAGTSEGAVREEIRRRLTVDALTTRIVGGVDAPTPEQVADAFEERSCSLEVPATRRLRNIVVPTRARAREVLGKLRDGARFAALARLASADGSTRDLGGDLGVVSAAQLDPSYAKAAFAAGAGDVFGPVRTVSGWNVGEVVSVTPGRTASLAEVAGALREQLLLEKQSRVWQTWLAGRIKAADVVYADDLQPSHPDAVPDGVGRWAETRTGLCSPAKATR